MLIEERLWGSGNRVHWTAEQIGEVCRHFGVDPLRVDKRRDGPVLPAPPLPSDAAKADGKQFVFTISTGGVDRQGDTVNVYGWHTAAYLRNPVVLWGHDYHQPPVGRAIRVFREDGALKASMIFANSRFAQSVREAVESGFIRATSVGFRPTKFTFSRDPSREWGIDFLEQELLEFSVVTVPANSEALVESREATLSRCRAEADKRERQRTLLKLKGGWT